MFISKLETLLYQENVPAIFICTLLRFMKYLKSDFTNCLPLFTTLDMWSILCQYLKPNVVIQKYDRDTRVVLHKGKNQYLNRESEGGSLYDAFALDAISILQLVLESVKKDPQLAEVLTRSVPFVENMLK